jgi:ribosomal protein S12 methylthiotransferase RimO
LKHPQKLHLVSLGCTKNLVDSEVMLGRLAHMELTDDPAKADVIIVNTCGFIEAAKSESIATVLDLHAQRKPDSLLVMAGCLSERYKDELQKELVEVDLFTGVGDYDRIDELLAKKQSRFSPQTFLIQDHSRRITGSRYHAYVKLSEGCNQRCSFCAIPHFKGRLHSRPLEQVVAEVKRLAGEGYKDFTFISQDSSSYLRDLGEKAGLERLIEAVERVEGVESARILYLYPSTTTFSLIDRIAASPIFVNHFDMPIQHISERMLRLMRRGAGQQRTKELLEYMRSIPNSFLRSAVIVGHPGESEADFEELREFLEDFPFDRLNVFAYSDEDGTEAFEMEQKIDPETTQDRLEVLAAIAQKKLAASLKKDLGRKVEAYLDGVSEESEMLLSARKILWAPEIDGEILVNDSEIEGLIPGERYIVEVTDIAKDKLVGRIVRRV